MTKKVKVAIFDADLQVEMSKHEISSKGDMISIKRGGKRNFNPSFNETSYLEMPKRFGGKEKVYFVRRNANQCIDFATATKEDTPTIHGPDPAQAVKATEAELIKNFGKEVKDTPWYAYATMALLGLIILILIQ